MKLIGNPAAAFPTNLASVFAIGEDGALYQLSQVAPNNGWSAWISRGTPQGTTLLSSPAVGIFNFIDLWAVTPVVIGNDRRFYSLPQHDGGNEWSGPDGENLAASPAVTTAPQGLPIYFAVGLDGILQSLGGTAQLTPHPGVLIRPSPVASPSQDGRVEVFAVGVNGALWHIWQTAVNGGWSDWASHGLPSGGALQGTAAMAASQDGRLELFVVAADGALWHIWQTAVNNGWSDWASHGTP